MPTVPAANLPYTGVPTAEPQVGVPSRFQTERATPEDFGAGVGAAVSNLGQQIGRGADVLAENAIRIQEQFNQVAASDATNKYQDNETKLMYGDPNSPGDVGFFGKKGEEAMRALPQVRDQILKLREGLRTGLQNPRQQIMFDSETRRLQAVTLSRMGEHYDREFNTYRGHVADAKIKNADSALGQAIAADDEPAATLAVKQRMEAELEKLRVQGLANNPDAVNAALQNARGDFVKVRAEALALKNPLAAVEYVKRNINALKGDEANQLLGRYRARGDALQAQVDAGLIQAPSRPAYEGKGGSSVDRFLDLAEDKESKGRNVVNYMYDSTHTAQGFFQITNTTWKGFAPGAGVDLSKYPTAMTAPYDVQRKVARQIVTTSGVQHWTQFNPALLRAAAQAGIPTFGPIQDNSPADALEAPANSPEHLAVSTAYGTAVAGGFTGTIQDFVKVQTGGPVPGIRMALPALDEGQLPDAQVPGMTEALKRIQENVPADDVVRRINAVKAARQALNAQYQDGQRALKLHNEQMKAQATLVQDDYLKRMYPGSPNPPSIQEVLTDNKLREHPEVKRTLVSFMERENKTDPAALVSKQNTMQLFAKMNLPDGEAEKITTEDPFNQAYTSQQVTRPDRDWLVSQFRTQRSAGGETLKNLTTQMITAVKPTILGPLAAADERLIEPDNALKLYNFIHAVDEKKAEYAKAGKNPVDLFNPKKPDFVGSDEFLRPYTADMAQRMRQQARERTFVGPPAPGEVPAPPVSTVPDITKIPDGDLIQGLNSRKIDYNEGVKELERRGYGHRPAPPVR
jgi:hypothetical protein